MYAFAFPSWIACRVCRMGGHDSSVDSVFNDHRQRILFIVHYADLTGRQSTLGTGARPSK